MKTLLLIIVSICTLTCYGQVMLYDAVLQGASFAAGSTGGGGGSTNVPSIVQSNYQFFGATSLSSFSKDLLVNATAGNTIIVEANSYGDSATASIADSTGDGNNWTAIATNFLGQWGAVPIWIWYKTNCIATNYGVTITLGAAASYNGIEIFEVSGVASVAALDAVVATTNRASQEYSLELSPAMTLSGTGDIICVFASQVDGACTNVSSGYNLIYGPSMATLGVPALGWKVSTATSEAPTAYWSTANYTLLQAFALKPK